MADDHHKISPTALMVARIRGQYTDMLYAKDIADAIANDHSDAGIASPFIRRLALLFPSVRARLSSLEGRYLAVNDALSRLGDCAVLEIAAGLSPRGLDYSARGTPYFETDLPGIISIKQDIVEGIRKKECRVPQNHILTPLNPLNTDELERVGELYWAIAGSKPLAVVHEGFFSYLTLDEQADMRDNMAWFLREYSPQGAWISPDFSYCSKQSAIVNFFKDRIARKTGRKFNHFKSQDEVECFLAQSNLKGVQLPNDHIVGKLSCVKKAKLDPAKVKDFAEGYRAWYITPMEAGITEIAPDMTQPAGFS